MRNLIHDAIIFATMKHAGQLRKGTGDPYITHPMEVMQILSENGYCENVIVAGILHDTLEDTKTSFIELCEGYKHNPYYTEEYRKFESKDIILLLELILT